MRDDGVGAGVVVLALAGTHHDHRLGRDSSEERADDRHVDVDPVYVLAVEEVRILVCESELDDVQQHGEDEVRGSDV